MELVLKNILKYCLIIILVTPLLLTCAGKAGKQISEIENSQYSMAVNAFLWRASLDALSFMILDKSDPIGGIISTEWFTDINSSNERVKIVVYIKDRRLRADGLSVSVFRQTKVGEGWVDSNTNTETSRLIENSILTKARELRIGTKISD